MKVQLILLITCVIFSTATRSQENPPPSERDLAFQLYYSKDYSRALELVKPLADRNDADEQIYQLAGNIYEALGQPKEAEKLYKRGIKKFSPGGKMYSEYGEMMMAKGDTDIAVRLWEKGIENDPGSSSNYYNACKYYTSTADNTWSLIYGEIFLNLESQTSRSAEIKGILIENYGKFFEKEYFKNIKDKSGFEQAFLEGMNKQHEIAQNGINPETLMMIRTRFILDWFPRFSAKFPFKLFEYQRQLLKEGLFEAYNQWLFGAPYNLVAYQNWTSVHSKEYNDFSNLQKNLPFKASVKQYYHK